MSRRIGGIRVPLVLAIYSAFFLHKKLDLVGVEMKHGTVIQTARKDNLTSSPSDDEEYRHTPLYAPSNETVLALISPPGIHGGYRNQVLRFLGLVTYALKNDIKYILLDSLVCVTPDEVTSVPELLSFASLYDIDYWNTFHDRLPQLVDYHESSNYTCWKRYDGEKNTTISGSRNELIERGNFLPLFNASRDIYAGRNSFSMYNLRSRSLPFTDLANECKGRPVGYGGGDKAMQLWSDVNAYLSQEKNTGKYPFDAVANLHRALRPNKKWRDLSKSCIGSDDTKYLGLHLRVELDILNHRCGKNNENNVTKIFQDIDEFLSKFHSENEGDFMDVISVATSRTNLEIKDGFVYTKFKDLADENLNMFNNLTNASMHNFGGKSVSVIECGQQHVNEYLDNHPDEKEYDYGALLPMIVDYEMLVGADIFIGVHGSSYSNDIWKSRYYLGKGKYNYEYTKDGIIPVGNGGLPSPKHCRRRRRRR
mmetsp:Transcript_9807/g.14598  ORF Transcript_9807/g.14598 Transcript_9807/m.14598 type:complete len:480 (-) Transcript_9807:151-1590(-)